MHTHTHSNSAKIPNVFKPRYPLINEDTEQDVSVAVGEYYNEDTELDVSVAVVEYQ